MQMYICMDMTKTYDKIQTRPLITDDATRRHTVTVRLTTWNLVVSPKGGSTPKQTCWLTFSREVTWTWTWLRMKCAWKIGWRGCGKSHGTPLWKPRSTASRGQWPIGFKSGGSDTLESLDSEDQSLWKMTKRVMRVPTPSPPSKVPGGLALWGSDNAEALADSLEAQFYPANDPSGPAVIGMVNRAMRAYEYAPASEPNFSSPSEVFQANKGLKAGKALGSNGKPKRVLRHLPKRTITFITKVFNTVLRRQYYPSVWKHARVVSILKPGKDPTLPSFYRPTGLLDTVDKLFEKILLARVLWEINERGLLRDEHFGFDPGTARSCNRTALLKEWTETSSTSG
jgi:hypothetical protein